MKLVKIQHHGKAAQGVLDDGRVHILGCWHNAVADQAPFDLPAKSLARLQEELAASKEVIEMSSVSLALPIDPVSKVICVGINYRDHAGETKSDTPSNPIIFTRTIDSLVAHEVPIVRPRVSETFDFEGEIGVVIGRDGRHISTGDAMSYVFGYTCFMDGSIREYQKHSLTAGKNFWHTGSMGPFVVTADEVGASDMELTTRLNGQLVQAAKLSQMIFGIREVIAYCSRWTPLRAGDVIATGTPGGVGSRRNPPLWMKPGDCVEVSVSGVGSLKNAVESEERVLGPA